MAHVREESPVKKPKGPIRFQIQLNEEQKLAKEQILAHDITLLKGAAGSAKTLLACNVSLDLLFKKEVDRIYVARPFVYTENEKLGALPGGISEKLIGLTTPIIDNMYNLYNKEKIDALLSEGIISILPLAFMRGMTLNNSVIILDEFQNAKLSQVYTALSRLGKNSKMIITGDMSQCDLPSKSESGFGFFKTLEDAGIVKIITLKTNHRHELVERITKIYLEIKD